MHGVHTKRGFTLIELLVVIAIIGILATIVIIQLAGAQTRARNSNAKSDVTEMGKSIATWQTTNTDAVPKAGGALPASAYTMTGAAYASLTSINAAASSLGFTALFSNAAAGANLAGFPTTVSKTPSANYTYLYVTNAVNGAGNAADLTAANATATSYCIATNVQNTGGVSDGGFAVQNGANIQEANGTAGPTISTGGVCS